MSEGDNDSLIYSDLYNINLIDFSQEMIERFILIIIYKDFCPNNQLIFLNWNKIHIMSNKKI